ncbi:MAG: acyltransferase [Calditrichaeota bacterium]|nr:acyltransferase [Calditrichota bacterium]MCB0294802.1 acyltransferase [Calditrichota bacterium]MCB0306236.1 acyltransferase [Calditrichota bacterium]MCB0314117.1 acyltransferase [Calditrichota bacterium]MCB9090140.1 acyltransferase [Calditrichia bacterium]
MLRIGYYQFRPIFGETQKNLSRIVKALSAAEADLIVLPELPFSGYYFRDRAEVKALAEDPEKSTTVATLWSLCRERDFYLVTGFAEKQRDKYFNSALLIGPEGVVHTYRKLHLFNEEKHWFDPGDTPLEVNSVRGMNLGIMVCFDWVFPEVTRSLAVLGADIICHPSNLVLSYCQQTMLSRCLENAIYAVTANRFGVDKRPHGELRFTGKSQIVAPKGILLHRAPSQRRELFISEIDITQARNKQMTPLNHLFEDRRPEYYHSLQGK